MYPTTMPPPAQKTGSFVVQTAWPNIKENPKRIVFAPVGEQVVILEGSEKVTYEATDDRGSDGSQIWVPKKRARIS
jgi:hypothetical protein